MPLPHAPQYAVSLERVTTTRSPRPIYGAGLRGARPRIRCNDDTDVSWDQQTGETRTPRTAYMSYSRGMQPDEPREEPDTPDDTAPVQCTLAGDHAAFEALVHRYERLVFRVVGGFFRSRADVDEVAQETFVRAFRALSTFRATGRFKPWIARIALSASSDRLRYRRRRPEVGWDALPELERHAARRLAESRDPADEVGRAVWPSEPWAGCGPPNALWSSWWTATVSRPRRPPRRWARRPWPRA
jgi:Sigma-70 region 2